MLKKIKKWFKDFKKIKCQKCKSIELEELDKNYIKSYTKDIYNHSKYDAPSERVMKEKQSSPDNYIKYKVYNIKYKCKNCEFIFNKEIIK